MPYKQQKLICHSFGDWKSNIRHQRGYILMGALFLIHSQDLLVMFSQREGAISGASFVRELVPLGHAYFPKSLFPNTITFGG